MDESLSHDIREWLEIEGDLCEPFYSSGDRASAFEIPHDSKYGSPDYHYADEPHFVRLFGQITIGYVSFAKRSSVKDPHKIVFRSYKDPEKPIELLSPGSGGDPERDIEILGLVENKFTY